MLSTVKISCDLCVVGGGIAGMLAAISAAREGSKVVLMHERPVLGGNASSEIRMWICGAKGKYNRETGILEEIALENLRRNPTKNYHLWDTVLYEFVRREENITLLLNCTCMDAETEEGEFAHGRTRRIRSVRGYQMTTQRFYEIEAKFFCDSSGDSILAPLCGAEFRLGREAAAEFGEESTTVEADSMTMGMSCLIQGRETTRPVKFTAPAWAKRLTREEGNNRRPSMESESENFWYLELGGDRDTIGDTETLRDELVPLALGMWDFVKNSGDYKAENWELEFLGFLPGKRESRRMMGEYLITQRDISDGRVFADEIAFGGWPLDDHYPGGFYHRGRANTNVQTPAPYSIPYRALYSKNVDNLFFAGRNISMTHMAMSSVRVMATCGLLGEAVGRAAAIAARENIAPHDVYLSHMEELQQSLLQGDCFLPSKKRAVGALCRAAKLSGGDDRLRSGEDRPHAIYGTDRCSAACAVPCGGELSYTFPEGRVGRVHITFDSDLERESLPGGSCERTHCTRANVFLNSPVMHMPPSLCRAFRLEGELGGVRTLLAEEGENCRRAWDIPVDAPFERLILTPLSNWGGEETVAVLSFDFN
ncbi:MAG: FAD-dependent oxidoreductase [Clostridia bacterium]|nr:FAD-dependent oxidoreductase [Clostridia bacterium]